jgi:hypothetical protein
MLWNVPVEIGRHRMDDGAEQLDCDDQRQRQRHSHDYREQRANTGLHWSL